MRRIDQVKNKKMKNVKHVEIIDKKTIKIAFKNNDEIIIKGVTEDFGYDFGYDVGIYIEKDNI